MPTAAPPTGVGLEKHEARVRVNGKPGGKPGGDDSCDPRHKSLAPAVSASVRTGGGEDVGVARVLAQNPCASRPRASDSPDQGPPTTSPGRSGARPQARPEERSAS